MTTVHGTGINGILDREEYGACNKVEKRRTSLCRILENLTEKFSLAKSLLLYFKSLISLTFFVVCLFMYT